MAHATELGHNRAEGLIILMAFIAIVGSERLVARCEAASVLLRGREGVSRSNSGASAECDRERARRKTAGILAYFEDFSRTQAGSAPAHAAETSDLPLRDPLAQTQE